MRKSPIRHRVQRYKRGGKTIQPYYRGKGKRKKNKRSKKVVVGKEITIDPNNEGYSIKYSPPIGKQSDYPRILISDDEKAVGFVGHPFEFDPSPMFHRTGFEGTKEEFLDFMSEGEGMKVSWAMIIAAEKRFPRHVFAYFDPQLQGAAETLYKKGYSTKYSQGYSYNWKKPGKDISFIHFLSRQISAKTQQRIKKIPGVKITHITDSTPQTFVTSDKFEGKLTRKPKKPVKILVIHFEYERSKSSPPTPIENQKIHDKWMKIVKVM